MIWRKPGDSFLCALERFNVENQIGFLYLAVSSATFDTIFIEEAGQLLLAEPGFRIIVFDPKTEEIMQWIPSQ